MVHRKLDRLFGIQKLQTLCLYCFMFGVYWGVFCFFIPLSFFYYSRVAMYCLELAHLICSYRNKQSHLNQK